MIKKFYDFFKNILSESEETVSNPLIQYSSETKSLEEFKQKNEVELVDNQKNELLDTIEINPATGLPSYGGIDVLGNPIGTDFNSSIEINPATGLPSYGGIDVLGNPIGTDFNSSIEINPVTGLPSYGGVDVLGNPIGTDFNSSIDTSFHDLGGPFNSDLGSSFGNDFHNN